MSDAEEYLKSKVRNFEKLNFLPSSLQCKYVFIVDALEAVSMARKEEKVNNVLKEFGDIEKYQQLVKVIRLETAKEIFDKEEENVLNELSLSKRNLEHDKDNPVKQHDVDVLKEWLGYVKDNKKRFLSLKPQSDDKKVEK